MALVTQVHKDALALLDEEQKKRKLSVKDMVIDIKASNFFSASWDELLISIPNALELLGNCTSVASTKNAETTPITVPGGRFNVLSGYTTLRGNLSELCGIGVDAFQTCRGSMDNIEVKSRSVNSTMIETIKSLADTTAPMSAVMIKLSTVKDLADACLVSAKEMETGMLRWSSACQELENACSSQSATTQQLAQKAKVDLELANKDQTFRVDQEKATQEELKKMKEEVDSAKGAYKKALDDMPTGASLVGMNIAMTLSEAAGTALVVGATAAAASINPVGGVVGGVQTLSKEVGKYVPPPEQNDKKSAKPSSTTTKTAIPDDKAQPASAAVAEKNKNFVAAKLAAIFVKRARPRGEDGKLLISESSVEKTDPKSAKVEKNVNGVKSEVKIGGEETEAKANGTTAPAATEITKPKESHTTPVDAGSPKSYGTYDLSGKPSLDDPALAIATTLRTAVDSIKEILVGSAEGIRWEAVLPPQDETNGSASEVDLIAFNLERLLADFQPKKGGLASQLTDAVLRETLGITDALQIEAKNAKDIKTWKKPDRKSQLYKDWDALITRCAQTAQALETASKGMPGAVGAAGANLTVPKQTTEEKIANMNYKASVCEQAVKSATTKMNAEKDVYQATMDTYAKKQELVLQVSEKLQKARQEVDRLTSHKLSLEEVKKVLIQCIGYLIDLREQIGQLVIFFNSLKNLIDTCIISQVKPFRQELEVYAEENKTKAKLFEKYYRNSIFKFTLQIMANFDLYRDVALMYLDVDKQVIIPGSTLVKKLNMSNMSTLSDEEFFKDNKKKLKDWCDKAQTTVHDVVKTKQTAILNGLQKRIDGLEQSIDVFPVEFKDQQAIEASKEGAKLVQAITEQKAATPTAVQAIVAQMADQEEETVDFD